VGLDHSGLKHEVCPVGFTVGLKPNPKGKMISNALEPNLMRQTKHVVVRGKGQCVPGKNNQISLRRAGVTTQEKALAIFALSPQKD